MGQGSANLVFTEPSPGTPSENPAHDVQQRSGHGTYEENGSGHHDRHDEEPDEHQHQHAGRAAPCPVCATAGSQPPRLATARRQGWTPSRRAERARCRLARIRRNRLTSIGSCARAAGESMRALSNW